MRTGAEIGGSLSKKEVLLFDMELDITYTIIIVNFNCMVLIN